MKLWLDSWLWSLCSFGLAETEAVRDISEISLGEVGSVWEVARKDMMEVDVWSLDLKEGKRKRRMYELEGTMTMPLLHKWQASRDPSNESARARLGSLITEDQVELDLIEEHQKLDFVCIWWVTARPRISLRKQKVCYIWRQRSQ